jgi:amidophosphoribosyltransferase
MTQTVGTINPQVQGFEASCFDGVYITGDISEDEVTALNEGRNRGGEEEADDASRLSLPNAQEA